MSGPRKPQRVSEAQLQFQRLWPSLEGNQKPGQRSFLLAPGNLTLGPDVSAGALPPSPFFLFSGDSVTWKLNLASLAPVCHFPCPWTSESGAQLQGAEPRGCRDTPALRSSQPREMPVGGGLPHRRSTEGSQGVRKWVSALSERRLP